MFLTAELVLTVLFLAAEKSKATFIAPVGIGLALFVSELTGTYDFPYTWCFERLTLFSRGILYWRFSQPGKVRHSQLFRG